jgi:hypothetical protein
VWTQGAQPQGNSIQQSFDANTKTNPKEPLLETGLKSVVGAVGGPFVHPLDTLKSIGNSMSYAPADMQAHADNPDEKITKENAPYQLTKIGGSMLGNLALGGAAGEMGGAAVDAIPRAGRAGSTLANIRSQAASVPVELNKSAEPLLRAQELGERGSTMPKPIKQLLNRTTDPDGGPLTFPEARDFYSNISRLSSKDVSKMNPIMQRQLGELRAAMSSDLSDAAGKIGLQDDYTGAMKEYRQASQLKDIGTKAAKYGAGALGVGIAGKVARDLVK